MPETPYSGLLDREGSTNLVNNIYHDQSKLLESIVNYGTNLLIRCYNSSEKNLSEAIILGVFLRHIIQLLDSIHILFSNSAIDSAFIQVRSLLEASFFLEWIMKESTEKKCKFYYVWNLRQKRLWALKMIKDSPEQMSFNKIINGFGREKIELPENEINPLALSEKISSLLETTPYKEINEIFERFKNRKGYDMEWYKPLSNSLRQITKDINREHEYAIFYSNISESTHSSIYEDHIKISDGTINFEPIRHLTNAKSLIELSVAFALNSYRQALTFYRPHELSSFAIRYESSWRISFRTVKQARYNLINS